MKTTLVVGDWSDDGHGKTASFVYEHNLESEKALLDAYKAGSLALGEITIQTGMNYSAQPIEPRYITKTFDDIMQFVACDYEDSEVPEDIVRALTAKGIVPNTSWSVEEPYEELYTCEDEAPVVWYVEGPEGFANLWMRIAKLGNPDMTYVSVAPRSLNIGGYGVV